MNTVKIVTLILLGFLFTELQAQTSDTKVIKKDNNIRVIKTTIDASGNKIIEEIIKEIDDESSILLINDEGDIIEIEEKNGQQFVWKTDDDNDTKTIQRTQTIEINDDSNGGKQITIITSGDNGENFNFNWNGDGAVPDKIKQELKEKGFDLKEKDGQITISSKDDIHKAAEHSNQAFLGVTIVHKETIEAINGEKAVTIEDVAMIEGIIKNSAAEKAGLQKDDIITAIDDMTISTYQNVVTALENHVPGDEITVAFIRAGDAMTTNATLKSSTDFQTPFTYEMEDEEIKITINADAKGQTTKKTIVIVEKDGEKTRTETIKYIPVVENTLDLTAFKVFPNPTKGKLHLKFTGEATTTIVRITDLFGKEFFRKELIDFDGNFDQKIKIRNAKKGILLLTISQGNKTFSEKIIME